MAETASKRSPSTTPRSIDEPQRSAASARGPSLTVRYWKKMRPNKVYPVVVSTKGRLDIGALTLRVVVAGAQVVPAEQPFDPANPSEKVTFYVTPLAKGPLRGERLEVLKDGVKIQEFRMPSRVCTQRPTLFWLCLSLLIPWLLMHYFMYSPIGFQAPLEENGTEKYIRRPWDDYYRPGFGEPRSIRITEFVEDNTPDLKLITSDKDILDQYDSIRTFPQKVYLHLFERYRETRQPIAFYVFLALLLIAFISFVLRQEGRKTLYGKPLPLGVDQD
jgi:hypothetical protein